MQKCLFLFYVENQSARQPCNAVSGSTGNGRPYRCGTGCERNQKCPYVSEVYTEHTRGKMRHLKPVCVTEMDIISSSVTIERYCHFFGWFRPFYTTGSRLIPIYTYRIFWSISRTFYQEICLKFSTCDLYCGCEKREALPSISRMHVPACSASGSLGATGGSMATRRCSYTAAFKLKLVEYAERHPCAIP